MRRLDSKIGSIVSTTIVIALCFAAMGAVLMAWPSDPRPHRLHHITLPELPATESAQYCTH